MSKFINIPMLTMQELLDLGFKQISEDSNLLIIPSTLWDQIPDRIRVFTLQGEMKKKTDVTPDLNQTYTEYAIYPMWR